MGNNNVQCAAIIFGEIIMSSMPQQQSDPTKSDPARQRQNTKPVGADVDLPDFFLDHLGRLDETKTFLLETRIDNLTVLSSLLWFRRDSDTR